MFDFHCHILPDVDDGSQSLEETIEMIKFLKENNFSGVIATPHANSLYFPKRENLNEIKENILKYVDFNIIIGYEVRIDAIENYDPRIFAIEGTNFILLEFDFYKKPSDIIEPFIKVMKYGLKPILAHPERYPYLTFNEIKKIKEFSVLIQVNVKSLNGFYGLEIMKKAQKLYEICDLVGSDAHSIEDYRNLKDLSFYNNKDFSKLIALSNK